jgi:hypothetical protein
MSLATLLIIVIVCVIVWKILDELVFEPAWLYKVVRVVVLLVLAVWLLQLAGLEVPRI